MPWGRVDDTYYDHPKLEELEDAHEWPDRLAGAGLNSLAWSWCNRFLTDGKVPRATVTKLGGTVELADQLVRVGLWEGVAGGYQIHDFLVYNDSREQVLARREKEAQRKANYRAGRRPSGTTTGTPSVDDAPVPSVVPASVPAGQPDVSRAESRRVSRDSTRARIPTRPVPSRPTESLRRESRATSDRPDVDALRDRGWKRVTAKQRAVLDEVLARHDVTGPTFAAEVIRATPADADPLEAVMTADRMWQDSQRRKADADEATWQATKAAEPGPRNGRGPQRITADEGPAWLTGEPETVKP